MARPAAVLDANVLYPARLRDLFLRLAIAANLSVDRPDIPAESLRRTRRLMGIAIPDAMVEGHDLIDRLDLHDPTIDTSSPPRSRPWPAW